MRRAIKSILITAALIFLFFGKPAHAETTTVYTTQSVKLQGVTAKDRKVGRNTKLKQIKKSKHKLTVTYKKETYYIKEKYVSKTKSPQKYTARKFRFLGVIYWKQNRYTWYSQRVLPGRGLKIPGRHVDKSGYVCDKDGYIVAASATCNRGKIYPTPFGKYAKVYDAGYGGIKWLDIYTAW